MFLHHVHVTLVNVHVMDTMQDAHNATHMAPVVAIAVNAHVTDMTVGVESVIHIRLVLVIAANVLVMDMIQDVANVIHMDRADVTQENVIVTIIVLGLVIKNAIHIQHVLVFLHIVHAIIKE